MLKWKCSHLQHGTSFTVSLKAAAYLVCTVSFPGFGKILLLISCFHKGAMWRNSQQIYIFWLELSYSWAGITGYTTSCSPHFLAEPSGGRDLMRRSSSTGEAARRQDSPFYLNKQELHLIGRQYQRTIFFSTAISYLFTFSFSRGILAFWTCK